MGALLERLFGLTENGTTVRREMMAGLTTFLAMAYILIVNPLILSNAIDVARDGEEALERLFDESARLPEVVLLDLKLPKIDGLEVLQEMRSRDRTRHVPVVVLTSSNEPHDRAAAFRYEVDDYIVKPHSFDEFATANRTVLAYTLPEPG